MATSRRAMVQYKPEDGADASTRGDIDRAEATEHGQEPSFKGSYQMANFVSGRCRLANIPLFFPVALTRFVNENYKID